MAGFLYYVPGTRPANRDHLTEIGFPHAHEAGAWCESPGPDGKRGYVFSLKATGVAGARQPEPAFDPKSMDPNNPEPRQVWHECEEGRWWLGWNLEDKPRPVDLQRAAGAVDELVTIPVTLEDSLQWQVPAIRAPNGTPRLPCVIGIRPDGAMYRSRPVPEYSRVWELTELLARVGAGGSAGFGDAESVELLSLAFGLSYRVSQWELGALGVLSEEKLVLIFAAIVGA